jgi:hypothetical protein
MIVSPERERPQIQPTGEKKYPLKVRKIVENTKRRPTPGPVKKYT